VKKKPSLKEEKVGTVRIFFSDEALKTSLVQSKADVQATITSFRTTADQKASKAVMIQRFTLMGVVLILSLTIVISRNIIVVKPLKTLTTMVVDLVEGDGDLIKRLQLKSRDEVGLLAERFNRFIERMHILVDEIAGNQSVTQNPTVAGQIAEAINDVDQAATQMNASSTAASDNAAVSDNTAVSVNAAALRDLAGQLTTMVGRFRIWSPKTALSANSG
jgi:methyl-accepting chemotaxis protein